MDCIDSYGSGRSNTANVVLENNKLVAKIKYWEEVPCGCHPETCCHFDGTKIEDGIYTVDVTGDVKEGDKLHLKRFRGYNSVLNVPNDAIVI